ncbi:MAG: hypothetical protein WD533_08740 [Dehalococcoidia bacterium]
MRDWIRNRIGPRMLFKVQGASSQRGAMLIEAVVAISVFTLIGAAVLSAMSTNHRASATVESSAAAENIARNVIEKILAEEPYPNPVPETGFPHEYDIDIDFPAAYDAYDFTAEARVFVRTDPDTGSTIEEDADGIVLIVVEVTRGGQTAFTLESLLINEG